MIACQKDQVDSATSDAIGKLNAQVIEIRKAHGYGSDVKFNFQTGQLEKSMPLLQEKKKP